MKLKNLYGAVAISILSTTFIGLTSDRASAITLNFDGLQDNERVQDFYNGGLGADGSSGGINLNYGASFLGSNNSGGIARNNTGTGPNNFSTPPSPNNALFFLGNNSNNNVLNVAGGFTSTFSFQYGNSTSNSPNAPAQRVLIYDGLNGSGNLLNPLSITNTLPDNSPPSGINKWDSFSIAFSGVARSVIFDVTANQVGFDNINLNLVSSSTPVPEPFTIIGTIVGGAAALRMRKQLKADRKD